MRKVKLQGETESNLKDVRSLTGIDLYVCHYQNYYYLMSGKENNQTSFGRFASLRDLRNYLNGYKHGWVNCRSGF